MEYPALRCFRSSELSLEEISTRLQAQPADIARLQTIVDDIIQQIRTRGDVAILEQTQRLDWPEATLPGLRVSTQEVETAIATLDVKLIHAMTLAAEHIRRFHLRQMPLDWFEDMEYGLSLGQRHVPVDSVACYVPTSKAPLPSSVLMSIIPAQVAGVPRIVLVGPCRRDGTMPPSVLAAAQLLGITEIYKLGGAVAMTALAIGTDTFPRVDKLVGPTNSFGMLAKRTLFGEVGIDGLNGPSDVTILADGSVPAAWVAADLLSQAEHGEDSPAILVTPNAEYAQQVTGAVATQLAASPRANYLSAALAHWGAIVITRDLSEAAAMVNLLAPEHLELMVENPRLLLPEIRHAGAIFLGGYSPVPVGDYFAGPSHVLPTGRTARFASGLSVMDFLKRSSLIEVQAEWLQAQHDAIITLAEHEGLAAHADAIQRRVK